MLITPAASASDLNWELYFKELPTLFCKAPGLLLCSPPPLFSLQTGGPVLPSGMILNTLIQRWSVDTDSSFEDFGEHLALLRENVRCADDLPVTLSSHWKSTIQQSYFTLRPPYNGPFLFISITLYLCTCRGCSRTLVLHSLVYRSFAFCFYTFSLFFKL